MTCSWSRRCLLRTGWDCRYVSPGGEVAGRPCWLGQHMPARACVPADLLLERGPRLKSLCLVCFRKQEVCVCGQRFYFRLCFFFFFSFLLWGLVRSQECLKLHGHQSGKRAGQTANDSLSFSISYFPSFFPNFLLCLSLYQSSFLSLSFTLSIYFLPSSFHVPPILLGD